MFNIFRKDDHKAEDDIWFELRLNSPGLLLWFVVIFFDGLQSYQRISMIIVLWMAVINTTSGIGYIGEYVIRLIGRLFFNLPQRFVFPLSRPGLFLKFIFTAAYLAITCANQASREAFLLIAPYAWFGWLLLWIVFRVWIGLRR